ncbi:hypothetical protein [Alkalihalobacillus sp. R86527]|uniref:hypothetical protein n=1 Tax=Alkalihalobacillus sp. R86527 TaxID=3093863 RepID=UPI0036724FAE
MEYQEISGRLYRDAHVQSYLSKEWQVPSSEQSQLRVKHKVYSHAYKQSAQYPFSNEAKAIYDGFSGNSQLIYQFIKEYQDTNRLIVNATPEVKVSDTSSSKWGDFSRKAKSELSSLPILSALSDATQGASGLGELQNKLKDDPNKPENWLYYYEATMMYKKMNSGVSIGRAVINPVGFVAGKGIAAGLNSIDDQFEKFDSKTCLGMTISLLMNKMKKDGKDLEPNELVLLGKTIMYSSCHAKSEHSRKQMIEKSIKYISKAIRNEQSGRRKSEYFYYLAECYDQIDDEIMYLKSLGIARKLGFAPADKLVKRILMKRVNEGDKERLKQVNSNLPYDSFEYTYSPNFEARFENSLDHVFKEQSKKFSETGKRLKKLWSKL